ncbi:hypothetical protein CON61_08090 [Bacillus toyonensis]|nr:hypothetical protein CON61_08090 [Bacillus toyonensis]
MCIKGFQETFIFFYGHDMAIDFHVSRKDEKQKKNLVNMIKSTVISIFQKKQKGHDMAMDFHIYNCELNR